MQLRTIGATVASTLLGCQEFCVRMNFFVGCEHTVVAIWAEKFSPMYLVRIILWPLAMSYTGFILTGQGLRTFNRLSITEAVLGALTGFLLAIMFTMREKRRQRPAFVAHSIVQFLPHLGALVPKRNRKDR